MGVDTTKYKSSPFCPSRLIRRSDDSNTVYLNQQWDFIINSKKVLRDLLFLFINNLLNVFIVSYRVLQIV